jgi:hypothetical protein
MSSEMYVDYLTKCIGKSPDECETMALTGSEVVEALWQLNDRFRPALHRIASLPYDPRFEQEADKAIDDLVFSLSDWRQVSAQAWRVLLERHQQAIIFFQLQPDEPFVPIPEALAVTDYTAAVLLFVLHGWTLPFPVADRSALAGPAGGVQESLTLQ